jgi:2-C-methyl-D-erythritol 4-phosphate cytidylyltransferase
VGGAVAAVPATETVKQVGAGHAILATPERRTLWHARTPQGFRREVIIDAHERAASDGFLGTDDAQLVERLGGRVEVVRDRHDNIKITMPGDLAVARVLWAAQRGEP